MMMSGKDFLRSHVRFELAAKGVFSLERCYIFRHVFGQATGKARLPTVDRLTSGTLNGKAISKLEQTCLCNNNITYRLNVFRRELSLSDFIRFYLQSPLPARVAHNTKGESRINPR